ncbi:unnamed protein product [Bursaphelenchus okinawaensis]|uniref:SAM-dependent MTase TRM10-type domain-containing protein n=1 Tax=Bursaphelenchus okinawaensis TaxID=465554 RepID=A0A811L3D2_9BILA|nr:unnamed protein product [Bursaphelenchus okinawaensis]CAG9116578.1 unnamed protein product [Bursaphelenchus okinawaensis]
MVLRRTETLTVDVSLLGEKLHFKTSGRYAKNRFLKAALSESLATWDRNDAKKVGLTTPYLLNLYEKWGHGGFGLVLTGNVMVEHRHLETAGNHVISQESWSDEKVKSFNQLAINIKQDGTLAIAQIGHAGRQTPNSVNRTPFSASNVQLDGIKRGGNTYGRPIALTLTQVQTEVIDRFVFTAEKLYEAGFDGVQLHSAHGYLLAQFISPTTNLRTDRYGGNAEKRAQILVDIYDAIRAKIPASTGFVIGIKLNSVEFQNHGLGIDDAITTAKIVDATGFDFIEFSGGNYESWQMDVSESTKKREGFFVQFTEAIKPHLKNTVVYVTGGFRTAPKMIQAIKEKSTDGIGLGRPISAEPDLPAKILTGRVMSASYNPVDTDFWYGYCVCMLDDILREFAQITIEDFVENLPVRSSRLSKQEKAQKHYEKVKQSRLMKRGEERKRQRPARKRRQKMEKTVLEGGLQIAIDFSFVNLMNRKESSHLIRQIGRIWGLQKQYHGLDIRLFGLTSEFSCQCEKLLSGFSDFKWKTYQETVQVVNGDSEEMFVYLSPDANAEPLNFLDSNVTYVIGGIVDETGVGNRTSLKAERTGHKFYRLPISEYSHRTKEPGSWTFNQMLALNQVVEALCLYKWTKDWKVAFKGVVPCRTGFIFE